MPQRILVIEDNRDLQSGDTRFDVAWIGWAGHTVNSHINRLRAKIENHPAQPVYILTVWGIGYKFAETEK